MTERDPQRIVIPIEVGRRRRDERLEREAPIIPELKIELESIYSPPSPSSTDTASFVKEVKSVQRRSLPRRIVQRLNPFKK